MQPVSVFHLQSIGKQIDDLHPERGTSALAAQPRFGVDRSE
jgi:hypothetical protein